MTPKEKDAKEKDAKKVDEKPATTKPAPVKEEKKPAAKKAAAKPAAIAEGPSRKEMIKAADEMNELMDLDPVIDTTQPDDKLRASIVKEAKEIVPDDVFSDATVDVLQKLSCIQPPKAAEEKPVEEKPAKKKVFSKVVKELRGPRPNKLDGMKIKLLVKNNPKKPGTAAHVRFALYKSGMTVKDAMAAGVMRADIWWDTGHKFIELKK